MNDCRQCGADLADSTCPACMDSERYDDHICDGLCDECFWADEDDDEEMDWFNTRLGG